jgi:hypothetical protein
MLLWLMLAILGLLVAFPDTLIARALHRLLVETLARLLSKSTPGRLTCWLGLGSVCLILFGLFEADGVRLFTFLAPDLILWFGMFDVALFLDVFLVATAMIASTWFRAAREQAIARFQGICSGVVRRMVRSRSRHAQPSRPKNADRDDPDPAGEKPWLICPSLGSAWALPKPYNACANISRLARIA